MFQPAAEHLKLGEGFYDEVEPADFGDLRVCYFNKRAAASIGLELDEAGVVKHFGRFEPFEGSLPKPLALRYHGHQFQTYNPDIGDGRGFLFAQCWVGDQLLDFGTKGTGTTPYSRSGDGRLTLKGAVREVLATSLLAAQGVPTSRTFAIIEDMGTQLYRSDEPSPTRAAVLTRLQHSHIRFGTFQRQAYEQRVDRMELLVRYCLKTYFNNPKAETYSTQEVAEVLLKEIVRRMALKVAAWMMAGFVHGVLNTDNMNITGESFDYGPWRWSPTYQGDFTAAYFDQTGLYAYGRQPRAVAWNLQVLASVLTLICEDHSGLVAILETFSSQLQTATLAQFIWRMGLKSQGEEADAHLAETCLKHLATSQDPFESLFTRGRNGDWGDLPQDLQGWERVETPAFAEETMLLDEVEALWASIADYDDWQPLLDKLRRLDQLYDTWRSWEAPSVQNMNGGETL